MKLTRLLCVAVFCIAVSVVHSEAASNLKLAFVTNNASDFWSIAQKGIQKAEKELGVRVTVKLPVDGTAAEQQEIINNLMALEYDGMAISPKDPDSMTDLLNAVAEKMALICHDSDAPASKRLAYIGTNNYDAGKILGAEVAKLLPNGGKMAIFVGTLSAQNARDRRQGILDYLKQTPNGDKYVLVADKLDETDRVKAKSNVEDVINAYNDISILIGLWSYNGPAIASALKSSGKQEKILAVCFDEEDETLQAVKDGFVKCTVVQKPFEFGYQSTKMLVDLCAKRKTGEKIDSKPVIIDTGVDVINKDNVEKFWANLKEQKK